MIGHAAALCLTRAMDDRRALISLIRGQLCWTVNRQIRPGIHRRLQYPLGVTADGNAGEQAAGTRLPDSALNQGYAIQGPKVFVGHSFRAAPGTYRTKMFGQTVIHFS